MTRRTDVDRLMSRYLNGVADADKAYATDPMYHAQVAWMRRTFTALDLVMEDEGIPEDVRLRVIRTLIYGAPSEAEALERTRPVAEATARRMVIGQPSLWRTRLPWSTE